ncbi:MAG: PEGA domain-containing protein [Polyangia bacterium]
MMLSAALLAALGATPEAAARRREHVDPQALLEQGAQALADKRYAAAYEAAAASHRAEPSARALYLLGMLEQAEGRVVPAHDLLRRFLADPQAAKEPAAALAEARRIVAEPLPPAGEVRLFGPRGAQVLIDDKLAGALPLSLPLLCAAGSHKIALEEGSQRLVGKVVVRAGHVAEMRFKRETGAVLVTFLPAVLFVYDGPAGEAAARFEQAALASLQTEGHTLLRPDVVLSLMQQPAGCQKETACVSEAAARGGATYVIRLHASTQAAAATAATAAPTTAAAGEPANWALTATLTEPALGMPGAEVERSCAPCSLEQAAVTSGELLKQALSQGSTRSRGTLLVRSTPPGAELREGGRRLGVTPFQGAAYTGRHTLVLVREGYEVETVTLTIQPGETATAEPVLREVPGPEPAPAPLLLPPAPPVAVPADTRARLPRPRWRLAAGGTALALGIVLGAFGASALAADGQCVDEVTRTGAACRTVYQTGTTGLGLTLTGAALSVGGAVLLLLPGPRAAASSTVASLGEASGSAVAR